MNDNRNQHYVPQYYLKNFSTDKKIHIYDLKNRKTFFNSISNTAYKRFLYNIDLTFFNKIIEDEIFEDVGIIDKIINQYNESILSPFFDSFNPTRERIINNDERNTISIISFHSLVDFILVQTYRNPKFSLFYKRIDEFVKEKTNVESKEYDKINRGIVILLLFNELHHCRKTKFKPNILNAFKEIIEEIKIMKELITNSYKMVLWNKTSIDFLTSDYAMSYVRLNETDLFSTIFVPINSKIAVLLVNKESPLFDKNILETSTIINLEEEDKQQVEVHNLSIIENANRFVYSINNDFPERIKEVEYKYWWNV